MQAQQAQEREKPKFQQGIADNFVRSHADAANRQQQQASNLRPANDTGASFGQQGKQQAPYNAAAQWDQAGKQQESGTDAPRLSAQNPASKAGQDLKREGAAKPGLHDQRTHDALKEHSTKDTARDQGQSAKSQSQSRDIATKSGEGETSSRMEHSQAGGTRAGEGAADRAKQYQQGGLAEQHKATERRNEHEISGAHGSRAGGDFRSQGGMEEFGKASEERGGARGAQSQQQQAGIKIGQQEPGGTFGGQAYASTQSNKQSGLQEQQGSRTTHGAASAKPGQGMSFSAEELHQPARAQQQQQKATGTHVTETPPVTPESPSMTEKAGQLADQAKGKASEMASRAKGKTEELADRAEGKASQMASQARGKTHEMADRAEGKASELSSRAKGKTAEMADRAEGKASELASRAKSTANDLADRAEAGVYAAAETARNKVDEWSTRAEAGSDEARGKGGEMADRASGKVQKFSDQAQGKAEELTDRAKGKAAELKGKAEGAAAQAKGKAEELTEEAKGKAEELADRAKGKATELKGKAEGAAAQAKGKAVELTEEAKGKASEMVDTAKGKAEEWTDAAKGKAAEVAEQAEGVVETVKEKAGELVDRAKVKAAELGDRASGKASEIKDIAVGKAAEVALVTKGKVEELQDRAAGKAAELTGKAKGKAAELTSNAKVTARETMQAVYDKAAEYRDRIAEYDIANRTTETAKAYMGAAMDKLHEANENLKGTISSMGDKFDTASGEAYQTAVDKVNAAYEGLRERASAYDDKMHLENRLSANLDELHERFSTSVRDAREEIQRAARESEGGPEDFKEEPSAEPASARHAALTSDLTQAYDAMQCLISTLSSYQQAHMSNATDKASEYVEGAIQALRKAADDVQETADALQHMSISDLPTSAAIEVLNSARDSVLAVQDAAIVWDENHKVSQSMANEIKDDLEKAQQCISAASGHVAGVTARIGAVLDAGVEMAVRRIVDLATRLNVEDRARALDAKFGISTRASAAASSIADAAKSVDNKLHVSETAHKVDQKMGGLGAAAVDATSRMASQAGEYIHAKVAAARAAQEPLSPGSPLAAPMGGEETPTNPSPTLEEPSREFRGQTQRTQQASAVHQRS